MTTTVLLAEALVAAIALGAAFLIAPRLRRLRAKVMLVVWVSFGAAIAGIGVAVASMALERKDLGLLLALLLFGTAVGAVCSLAIVRTVVNPLEDVADASTRLAEGDLAARVTPESRDETAALAETFNAMAESIEIAWRERDRAAEAHRTLIASISHDLRTPLASLRAMVEALEDGIVDDPETEKKYLCQMRRQVDDLALMIEDLFALSRLEAGDLELTREPVDMTDLVSDTVEEFRARAAKAGVTVDACGSGPALVSGNAAALQRILRNLVDNALRHSPSGGSVAIEVGTDDGTVLVEISDAGSGFDPAFLDSAFEAFTRGDPSRSRATGGAGLGLAIARHLAVAHGGNVVAANRESGGATLTVELPAAEERRAISGQD